MAVTENTYTGNGSTTNYSITFPYLSAADIKVQVNGAATTAYTFANATTISFNTAPANNAPIRIYRETGSVNLNSTFFPGSAIRAQDLNDNFLQSLYLTQEVANNLGQASAATIADNTVGTAALVDAAVTTTKISNNAITSTKLANNLTLASPTHTGTTTMGSVSISGNFDNTSTGYLDLPTGTTAQRPASPNAGMVRYNTDISQFEGYNGSSWQPIGGGAFGGGSDRVFLENDNAINSSYTLSNNRNAVSAGPVTIASGVNVVIPTGQSWVIV